VEDATAAPDATTVRRHSHPPSKAAAARQAQPPRRLRRAVGRAQDQAAD